ncbi:hypothetical protein PSAC2689_100137 [Paraburkholderia sacchari]
MQNQLVAVYPPALQRVKALCKPRKLSDDAIDAYSAWPDTAEPQFVVCLMILR